MLGQKRNNSQPLSIEGNKARKNVISSICMYDWIAQEKNISSSGAMTIIDEAKLLYPLLTKDILYVSVQRSKAKANANARFNLYI